MGEKKVVMRTSTIILGSIFILLSVGIVVAAAHYADVVNDQYYWFVSNFNGYGSSYSFTASENKSLVGKASNWSSIIGYGYDDVAKSLVITSDGGYAIAGATTSFGNGNYEFWLVKTDSKGVMEWNRVYGIGGASALVAASDGGYAVVGGTRQFGWGTNDFSLVKTDVHGNMEWSKTYGGGDADALVATSDGGYALAGQGLLIKTDALGNMQWNKTYEGSIRSLIATSDGGYALAGRTNSFGGGGYDAWLVKTDSNGVMEWSRTYGGTGNDYAESLVAASDGGYALAGMWNGNDNNPHVWLAKTDSIGNLQWNRTYEEPEGNWDSSLAATSDGGYALASGSLLVKTDAHGNKEWNRTYGGTGNAYALVAAPDGGYALAGDIWSYEGTSFGSHDLWILKTTETGETSSVPEYSSWLIPALVLTATAFIITNKKRLPHKHSQEP